MAETEIIEFYPTPVCVHERMREIFASYGTRGSVNVKPAFPETSVKKKKRHSLEKSIYVEEKLSVEFQCQMTRGCSNKLFATHPSYPLLPPNACKSIFSLLISGLPYSP